MVYFPEVVIEKISFNKIRSMAGMAKKEFNQEEAKRYAEIKSRISSLNDELDHTFNSERSQAIGAELAELEKERDKMLGLL
jgi:hypothetical protein